jgi:hypothetical protein
MTQEALSQLIECARLLGQTQAKKALSIFSSHLAILCSKGI